MRGFEYVTFPTPAWGQPRAQVSLGDICPSAGPILSPWGPVRKLFSSQETFFFCGLIFHTEGRKSVCLCSWLLMEKLISETPTRKEFSRVFEQIIHVAESVLGRESTFPKHA